MLCITPKVTFDSLWGFVPTHLTDTKRGAFFCFLSGLHLNQLSVLAVVWQCQLSCARRRASWATEGRADACACAPSAGPAPRQSSRQCGWPRELQAVGLGTAAGGDRVWPWCSVSGIAVYLQNVGHWGLIRVRVARMGHCCTVRPVRPVLLPQWILEAGYCQECICYKSKAEWDYLVCWPGCLGFSAVTH